MMSLGWGLGWGFEVLEGLKVLLWELGVLVRRSFECKSLANSLEQLDQVAAAHQKLEAARGPRRVCSHAPLARVYRV